MYLNRLLDDEELTEEEKDEAVEAWGVLYKSEVVIKNRSERRVGIVKKVLTYALKRLGAYEIDFMCVVIEWMDGIIWKCLECDEDGEVQESEVWVDCEDDCEDGEGIEGE